MARIADVLPRETALGGELAAPEDLGGDAVSVAREPELLQRAPHDALGLTGGVRLGVVEEVDAGLEGELEQLDRGAVVHLRREGDPRAEGERADLEAGTAEAAGGFVHFHADGTVHRGRWVATGTTSFQDFGAADDSERHGGVLRIVVTHFHGGTEHTGIPMSVTSVVNAPSTHFVEGTTVDGFTVKTRGTVVIEDDARYQRGLEALFEQAEGFSLAASYRAAPSALDDVDLALREGLAPPWDVALVDLQLPGMSGIDLARRVRQALPGVGVVLLAVVGLFYGGYARSLRIGLAAGVAVHARKEARLPDRLHVDGRARGQRRPAELLRGEGRHRRDLSSLIDG